MFPESVVMADSLSPSINDVWNSTVNPTLTPPLRSHASQAAIEHRSSSNNTSANSVLEETPSRGSNVTSGAAASPVNTEALCSFGLSPAGQDQSSRLSVLAPPSNSSSVATYTISDPAPPLLRPTMSFRRQNQQQHLLPSANAPQHSSHGFSALDGTTSSPVNLSNALRPRCFGSASLRVKAKSGTATGAGVEMSPDTCPSPSPARSSPAARLVSSSYASTTDTSTEVRDPEARTNAGNYCSVKSTERKQQQQRRQHANAAIATSAAVAANSCSSAIDNSVSPSYENSDCVSPQLLSPYLNSFLLSNMTDANEASGYSKGDGVVVTAVETRTASAAEDLRVTSSRHFSESGGTPPLSHSSTRLGSGNRNRTKKDESNGVSSTSNKGRDSCFLYNATNNGCVSSAATPVPLSCSQDVSAASAAAPTTPKKLHTAERAQATRTPLDSSGYCSLHNLSSFSSAPATTAETAPIPFSAAATTSLATTQDREQWEPTQQEQQHNRERRETLVYHTQLLSLSGLSDDHSTKPPCVQQYRDEDDKDERKNEEGGEDGDSTYSTLNQPPSELLSLATHDLAEASRTVMPPATLPIADKSNTSVKVSTGDNNNISTGIAGLQSNKVICSSTAIENTTTNTSTNVVSTGPLNAPTLMKQQQQPPTRRQSRRYDLPPLSVALVRKTAPKTTALNKSTTAVVAPLTTFSASSSFKESTSRSNNTPTTAKMTPPSVLLPERHRYDTSVNEISLLSGLISNSNINVNSCSQSGNGNINHSMASSSITSKTGTLGKQNRMANALRLNLRCFQPTSPLKQPYKQEALSSPRGRPSTKQQEQLRPGRLSTRTVPSLPQPTNSASLLSTSRLTVHSSDTAIGSTLTNINGPLRATTTTASTNTVTVVTPPEQLRTAITVPTSLAPPSIATSTQQVRRSTTKPVEASTTATLAGNFGAHATTRRFVLRRAAPRVGAVAGGTSVTPNNETDNKSVTAAAGGTDDKNDKKASTLHSTITTSQRQHEQDSTPRTKKTASAPASVSATVATPLFASADTPLTKLRSRDSASPSPAVEMTHISLSPAIPTLRLNATSTAAAATTVKGATASTSIGTSFSVRSGSFMASARSVTKAPVTKRRLKAKALVRSQHFQEQLHNTYGSPLNTSTTSSFGSAMPQLAVPVPSTPSLALSLSQQSQPIVTARAHPGRSLTSASMTFSTSNIASGAVTGMDTSGIGGGGGVASRVSAVQLLVTPRPRETSLQVSTSSLSQHAVPTSPIVVFMSGNGIDDVVTRVTAPSTAAAAAAGGACAKPCAPTRASRPRFLPRFSRHIRTGRRQLTTGDGSVEKSSQDAEHRIGVNGLSEDMQDSVKLTSPIGEMNATATAIIAAAQTQVQEQVPRPYPPLGTPLSFTTILIDSEKAARAEAAATTCAVPCETLSSATIINSTQRILVQVQSSETPRGHSMRQGGEEGEKANVAPVTTVQENSKVVVRGSDCTMVSANTEKRRDEEEGKDEPAETPSVEQRNVSVSMEEVTCRRLPCSNQEQLHANENDVLCSPLNEEHETEGSAAQQQQADAQASTFRRTSNCGSTDAVPADSSDRPLTPTIPCPVITAFSPGDHVIPSNLQRALLRTEGETTTNGAAAEASHSNAVAAAVPAAAVVGVVVEELDGTEAVTPIAYKVHRHHKTIVVPVHEDSRGYSAGCVDSNDDVNNNNNNNNVAQAAKVPHEGHHLLHTLTPPHSSSLQCRREVNPKMRDDDVTSFLCTAVPSINEEKAQNDDGTVLAGIAETAGTGNQYSPQRKRGATPASQMEDAAAVPLYDDESMPQGTSDAKNQPFVANAELTSVTENEKNAASASARNADVTNAKSHLHASHLSRDVVEEALLQVSVPPSCDLTTPTHAATTTNTTASSNSVPKSVVFSSGDSATQQYQGPTHVHQQQQPPPCLPHPITTTLTNAAAITRTPTATVCYHRSALYSFFASGRSGSLNTTVYTTTAGAPITNSSSAVVAPDKSSFYNSVDTVAATAARNTLYKRNLSSSEFITASLNSGAGCGASAMRSSSPMTRLTTILFTYNSANAGMTVATTMGTAGDRTNTRDEGNNRSHRSLSHTCGPPTLWSAVPPPSAASSLNTTAAATTAEVAAIACAPMTSLSSPRVAREPSSSPYNTLNTTSSGTAVVTAAAAATTTATSSAEDVVVGLKSADKKAPAKLVSPALPLDSLSPQLPSPPQHPEQQQQLSQQQASNTFAFFPPRRPLLQSSALMVVSAVALRASSPNSSLRPLAKRKWTSAIGQENSTTLSRRGSLFEFTRIADCATTEVKQRDVREETAIVVATANGRDEARNETLANGENVKQGITQVATTGAAWNNRNNDVTGTATIEPPLLPVLDQNEIGQLWKEVCASTPKNADHQRNVQHNRRRGVPSRQWLPPSPQITTVFESNGSNINNYNQAPDCMGPRRSSRRRSPLWSSHRSATPTINVNNNTAVAAVTMLGGDAFRVDFSDRTSSSSGTTGNILSRDATHMSFPSIAALMNSDDEDDVASADRQVREELAFLEYDPDLEEILRAKAEVMRRTGRRPSVSRLQPTRRVSAHFSNDNSNKGETVVKPCLQPTSSFARKGRDRRPHSSPSVTLHKSDSEVGVSPEVSSNNNTSALRDLSGVFSQLRRAHSSMNKSESTSAEGAQPGTPLLQQQTQQRRYPWHSPAQSAQLLNTNVGLENDDIVDTFTSHSRTVKVSGVSAAAAATTAQSPNSNSNSVSGSGGGDGVESTGSCMKRSGACFRITAATTPTNTGPPLNAHSSLSSNNINTSTSNDSNNNNSGSGEKAEGKPEENKAHAAAHDVDNSDKDTQQELSSSWRPQLSQRRHRTQPSVLSGTADGNKGGSVNAQSDSSHNEGREEKDIEAVIPTTATEFKAATTITVQSATLSNESEFAAARGVCGGAPAGACRQRRAVVAEPEDGGVSPVLSFLAQAKSRPAPLMVNALHLPGSPVATNKDTTTAIKNTNNKTKEEGDRERISTAAARATAEITATTPLTVVPTPFLPRPSPSTVQRALEGGPGDTNHRSSGCVSGLRNSDENATFTCRPLHFATSTTTTNGGTEDEKGEKRHSVDVTAGIAAAGLKGASSGRCSRHSNNGDTLRVRSVLSESLATVKSDRSAVSAGTAQQPETVANVSFAYHPLTLNELAVHNTTPLFGNAVNRSAFTICSGFNSAQVSNADSRFVEPAREEEVNVDLLGFVVTDHHQQQQRLHSGYKSQYLGREMSDQVLLPEAITMTVPGGEGSEPSPEMDTAQARSQCVSVNGPTAVSVPVTQPLLAANTTAAGATTATSGNNNTVNGDGNDRQEPCTRLGKPFRGLPATTPVVSPPEDNHDIEDEDGNDTSLEHNIDSSDTSSIDLSTAQLQPWTSTFPLGTKITFTNITTTKHHHCAGPAGVMQPSLPDHTSPSAGPGILIPSRKYHSGGSAMATPTPAPYVALAFTSDGMYNRPGSGTATAADQEEADGNAGVTSVATLALDSSASESAVSPTSAAGAPTAMALSENFGRRRAFRRTCTSFTTLPKPDRTKQGEKVSDASLLAFPPPSSSPQPPPQRASPRPQSATSISNVHLPPSSRRGGPFHSVTKDGTDGSNSGSTAPKERMASPDSLRPQQQPLHRQHVSFCDDLAGEDMLCSPPKLTETNAGSAASSSSRPSAICTRSSHSGVASISPMTSPAGGSVLVLPHPPTVSTSASVSHAETAATTHTITTTVTTATTSVTGESLAPQPPLTHHHYQNSSSTSTTDSNSNRDTKNEGKHDNSVEGDLQTTALQRPPRARHQQHACLSPLASGLGPYHQRHSSGSNSTGSYPHPHRAGVHGPDHSLSPAVGILHTHGLQSTTAAMKPATPLTYAHSPVVENVDATGRREVDSEGNSLCNANSATTATTTASEKGLSRHQTQFASRRSGTRNSVASSRSGSGGRPRTYDWAGSVVGSVLTMESNSLLSSPTDSNI